MKKLVSFHKNKKEKATTGVNTEPLPGPSQQLLGKINSIEELALNIKRRVTSRNLKRQLPPFEILDRHLEIREDRASQLWYDLRDLRSFKISSVKDLFQIQFDLTGRFTPSSTQVLNLSFDEVSSALERVTSSPTEATEFCRFYFRNNSDQGLAFIRQNGDSIPSLPIF